MEKESDVNKFLEALEKELKDALQGNKRIRLR
jgi:hypothetical protein